MAEVPSRTRRVFPGKVIDSASMLHCLPSPIARVFAGAVFAWSFLAPALALGNTGGLTLEPGLVHESWSVEEGLPSNTLGRLLQAKDGYLWIATFDGLVRFDGSRFRTIRTDTAPALGSNRIVAIEELGDSLWIWTEPGILSRFRDGVIEATGISSGAHSNPTPMKVGVDGNIWVGVGSVLYRIQPDGRVEEMLRLAPEIYIRRFSVDRHGRLWLGTSAGIALFENQELRWIHSALNVAGILMFRGGVLFFRSEGPPLLYESGLWQEPLTEVLPDVTLLGTATVRPSPWGGSLVLNNSQLLGFSGGDVELLAISKNGTALHAAAAQKAGGHRWWAFENRVFQDGEVVFEFPQGQQVSSLLEDEDGTLWLATDTGGLHSLRQASVATLGRTEGLENENTYAVMEDSSSTLWVGTHGDGLWRVRDGRLTRAEKRSQVGMVFVRAIAEDPRGGLWVGLLEGLYRLEGDRLMPSVARDGSRIRDRVNAILTDEAGRYWVGTSTGLFYSRLTLQGSVQSWQAVSAAQLPHRNVRTLVSDADQGLWVGTAGGIARLQASTSTIFDQSSGLPSGLVRALHIDDHGVVWVGTEDRGLLRMASGDSRPKSPAETTITQYNTSNGLFSNGVHSIVDDGIDHLWMSSNQGLFRVRKEQLEALARGDRLTIESVAYSEKQGMRNREANGGSLNSGMRSSDGRVWFTTQGGVAVVDPAKAVPVRKTPKPPTIETIRIEETGKIYRGDRIQLRAEERSFSIRYTAISLAAAERLRFRYRLVGYNQQWVDVGARREAFFTRVPAGHYTFQVESRVAGLPWAGSTTSLELAVLPYSRETFWFRFLGLLSVLALVLVAFRYQARRQRYQKLRLERLVEERTAIIAEQTEKLRELDRLKSELFTNVSHEFRTPLTLAIGPLQDLLHGARGELSEGVADDVALALRNSRRVLGLIHQILDVARLEAGQLRLRVREGDLLQFAEHHLDSFLSLAERAEIAVEFRSDLDSALAWFDPEQLGKVLENLLANAFNLTPSGGRVTLSVARSGTEAIRISIRDTGPGIPEEDLENIFERFHQGSDAGGRSSASGRPRRWVGTGVGLALAKEIVELHHGKIEVSSVLGQGAEFVVVLLAGFSHFDPRELADEPATFSEGTAADGLAWRPAAIQRTENSDHDVQGRSVQEAPAFEKPTVLVVDDNSAIRSYVRRGLEAEYCVCEAGDGVEALQRIAEHLPDLVLADVMMPNMDGLELVRELAADPELSFIPIVLLTAKASVSSKVEGLGLGVADYLTKPFDSRELRARVRNLIEGRRRLLDHRTVPLSLSLPGVEVMPADKDFVHRAQVLIEANLADETFGVGALAKGLKCDRSYLFRKFKDLLDETPSAALRRLRLERAEQLIVGRAGSVSDIAYQVGFRSVSHFSKSFREHFGATPTAYASAHEASQATLD